MSNIPKVIHYCWFGKGEKDDLILKCIESWRKYFPDYEIKEWTEDNYDVYGNAYIQEAYEQKKWAFVSDYARLDIIYQYGGIYFDTDVEVVRDFRHLLEEHGYLAFENTCDEWDKKTVNTGLGFAAPQGNKIIKALMEDYQKIHFMVDGKMDITACPVRNTAVLKKIGLNTDGSLQKLEDLVVYPFDFFCGYDFVNRHPVITENTYTIHHYSATWCDKLSLYQKIKYNVVIVLLQKILGYERYDKWKFRFMRLRKGKR